MDVGLHGTVSTYQWHTKSVKTKKEVSYEFKNNLHMM